ncbi:MAG: class I SAM-dependent methyltransferase [Chloroflexi bacterium]|nr:MAG: class I SAM-dependent methyltransferase [Chloroflexota bacterium]
MTIPEDVEKQYATPANLDARIALHERFSTTLYPWMRWVFDQIDAPDCASILEVGCGTGALWAENSERIPPEWSVTLVDQSAGMLEQARANLAEVPHSFRFEQGDVQRLPFATASFDAVVANHMLYHVADLAQGLAEIHRVLKAGGKLFAATNGEMHMYELRQLLNAFDSTIPPDRAHFPFTLENGAGLLAPYFARVELRRYESALAVTEAAPLVAYILSMDVIPPERRDELTTHVEDTLRAHGGMFRIQKATGLFVATKRS